MPTFLSLPPRALLLLGLLLSCWLSSYAQETTLSGTVTDLSTNETLPGVNILVKGTTVGTVTDIDGKYTLSVSDDATVLVFSSVGYTTEEVSIDGRSAISVGLAPDIQSLSEIVVVGYGEQKRAELTGAIASVEGEEIENLPTASTDGLLQGRAAGVQVVQSSGTPGGAMSVRVRGISSVNAGNDPLYVVDGVPIKSGNFTGLSDGTDGLNALADINPNDIASIDVLKDASAASIYGSRASGGVVIITTKQGKSGKPTISFNYYRGVQRLSNKLESVNARQFREIFTEGWFERADRRLREVITDTLNYTLGGDTDWQDNIFRDAPISNYDLSLRGGSEQLKYSLSAGYFDQEGILLNSGYKRFTGRTNVDYQASERLTVGSNISFAHANYDLISQGIQGRRGAIRLWMNTPPIQVPVDDQGRVWEREPSNTLTEPTQDAVSDRFIANIYGQYEILEGLSFRSNIALDLLFLKEDQFFPSTAPPIDLLRQSSARFFKDLGWINENTLTYQKTFNELHNVTALLGFSQQRNQSESILAVASEAPFDKITTVNAGATLVNAQSFTTSWALVSYFARLNYNFDDRYLVTATVRRDGSSRFGQQNQYGIFPSASVGWRVSEESFMENMDFFDNLKLRASWGLTGNQEGIGNFVSQGAFGTGENYLGLAGIAPTQIPNPILSWETTEQIDIGLDFSILNQRVNVITDFYRKVTDDLLFEQRLPGSSGFTNLLTNLGSIENRGIELGISTRNLVGAFTWSTNFNIAFNRNKVLSLPNGEDVFTSAARGIQQVLREGEPLGSFYGWHFDGVYPTTEDVPAGPEPDTRLRNNANGPEFEGGDAIFRDLNNDGIIDEDDRDIIGNAQPDFTGGITNTLAYQGFELSFFFNYSYGNEVYNLASEDRNAWEGLYVQPSLYYYNNRWQNPGDITDVPVNYWRNPRDTGRPNQTQWIEDGSFLRLKNITFAYNLPATLLDRVGLGSIRLYATGQNLLTFTDYTGYDPEAVTYGSADNFGIDFFRFPIAKSVILGVNVSF